VGQFKVCVAEVRLSGPQLCSPVALLRAQRPAFLEHPEPERIDLLLDTELEVEQALARGLGGGDDFRRTLG
jgi:hypothetical protein